MIALRAMPLNGFPWCFWRSVIKVNSWVKLCTLVIEIHHYNAQLGMIKFYNLNLRLIVVVIDCFSCRYVYVCVTGVVERVTTVWWISPVASVSWTEEGQGSATRLASQLVYIASSLCLSFRHRFRIVQSIFSFKNIRIYYILNSFGPICCTTGLPNDTIILFSVVFKNTCNK